MVWMDLDKAPRVNITGYSIPRSQHRYSKGSLYFVISHKDSNNFQGKIQVNHITLEDDDNEAFQDTMDQDQEPPEFYNLTSFNEENKSEKQKRQISNSICTNYSTTSFIYISEYKQAIYLDMNIKSNRKYELMEYGYAGTSVAEIVNGFVEVYWNEIKAALVGFDDDIFNKSHQ